MNRMDIASTTEPKSDQQNFDDYIAGPKTVTVSEVKRGTPEQPVEIHLVEFPGRPFKPSKSMRRVLIACWGAEAASYAGHRMTLYGDPTVKFGGQDVGGIRISHLSHIDGPQTISLTVTRAKRAPFTVQPLPTDTGALEDALADIEKAKSIPALKAAWDLAGKRGLAAHPDVVAAKERRKTELTTEES
jgi:hypothetical protein